MEDIDSAPEEKDYKLSDVESFVSTSLDSESDDD